MPSFLILTIIGPDRPGLVESLSQVVVEHDGNWLESRMSHLAGMFAGILRVAVPASRVDALRGALGELQARGLRIMVESSEAVEAGSDRRLLRLELIGNDRPGIVREIAHALAQRGVNVEELDTELVSAPMSGELLFKASALLRAPASLPLDELSDRLEALAHDLVVELSLDDETEQP